MMTIDFKHWEKVVKKTLTHDELAKVRAAIVNSTEYGHAIKEDTLAIELLTKLARLAVEPIKGD